MQQKWQAFGHKYDPTWRSFTSPSTTSEMNLDESNEGIFTQAFWGWLIRNLPI
jgi:hypothetical protein